MRDDLRVAPDELRRVVDPAALGFETTKDVMPHDGAIGQERANRSLFFGLNITRDGFNTYAAGPVSTGRTKTVMEHIRKIAEEMPTPCDWCYVNNFEDSRKPKAIKMPAGRGREFVKDMEELVNDAKRELPKVFESEEYEERHVKVVSDLEKERERMLADTQEKAAKLGFAVRMTLGGLVTVPLVEGKPMEAEEFEKLPEGTKEEIRAKGEEIQTDIHQIMHKVRAMEKEARNRVGDLDKEIALLAVGHLLDSLREKYADCDEIISYLKEVQDDIVENLELFKTPEEGAQQQPAFLRGLQQQVRTASMGRYAVNLFVDNAEAKGAPVVIEHNPNYYNLFGRIEYESAMGGLSTDFNHVKAGAVQRANGGYLVFEALDALVSPLVWDTLKRMLKSGKAKVENMGQQYMLFPAVTIDAEPIPLNIKIVMMGTRMIYNIIHHFDEDFRRLFKVKADFDTQMDRTDDHMSDYAAYIADRVQKGNLPEFDATGVAKVIEFGSWLAENQKKLSTLLENVGDLVDEAAFWAQKDGDSTKVTADHVRKAIGERRYRANMAEDKVRELIAEGTLMIDTEGEQQGQVNGMAVLDMGDYSFGRPSRITARTHFGRGGVTNIEREVKMSGPIHDKGVLILSGYLAGKYGQNKPIAMGGTITFEQSYEGVEGDSASSTELYALLSSLAEAPIKQNIAVTGSVNQYGHVQPIGGVNRKIEGFFDVCKAKGFTGEQGMLIPKSNVKHLMLREDVVEAIKDGKFHLWAVDSIDEGIEILTGMPAGEQQADGTYPEETINRRVDDRLAEYAKVLKEFGREAAAAAEGKKEEEERAA
ncbi:MAG: ATP-dependent protease [Actinobacteria bacterium]|nr:MAG: ATP-dependent protease [Actinomycetota bacterium]